MTHTSAGKFRITVVALAVLAALTVVEPTLMLRRGAEAAAVLAVINLRGWRPTAADISAALLAALGMASLLWAADPIASGVTAYNQLACAVLFIAARIIIRTRRDIVVVSLGVIAGAVYSLVRIYQNAADVVLSNGVTNVADARYGLTGLNVNYTAYGLAVAAVMCVIVWTTRQHVRRIWWLIAVAGVAVITWGITRNGTRGALLSVAALVLWVAWRGFRRRPTHFRVVCVVSAAVSVAITAGWLDPLLGFLDANTSRSTGDLTGRLSIWPVARQVLLEHPVGGIGIGGFATNSENGYGIAAHNVLLDTGTGLGIPGIALFCAVLYYALIRDTAAADPRRRALIVGAFIVVMLPISLSGYWVVSAVAWLTLGVVSRVDVISPARKPVAQPAHAPQHEARPLQPQVVRSSAHLNGDARPVAHDSYDDALRWELVLTGRASGVHLDGNP